MSVVTLIELSPRRPSDGVVEPLRFVHNARVTGRFLGQQWRPLVASLPESEADLGFDGLMFAQGGYPQVGRLVVAVGASETWPALMWNGAAVALRVAPWPQGDGDPADGDFGPAMPARVESLSVENGVATFTLIDSAQHLRRPVTSRRFGSTGIALLDSADVIDHKGAVVPTGWGRLLNVPGILVDRANNIWLFLDRPAASAQGFYDGGKAFAPGVARADLAALRANSPAAGAIDWALNAAGMVLARPWTAPTYVLTADLTTTPETVADIAQAMVAARTTLVFAAGTVAAFNALQPAPAGLYVDDERSIGDALNSLLAGVGGWWRLNSAGDIALGRFGITAPARTFAAHEFISVRREEIIAPTRRRSVGWGRNNRVHSEGEIATILLIDDIDGLGDLATQDQVDWSQVAGAGKPADGATRNAYRGVHNPANAYQMGDEVSNAGNDELWVAITDVPPGITLGNPAYWSLKLVSGGGAPGVNNATIFLYQRTGTDVPPAVPAGTLTFTFATNALSGALGAWSRSMPLSGGPYRWMITAQAVSAAATDDIAPGEWPTPALQADAMPNVDGAFLYARAATAPALPAAALTFTFATRILSGALGAWTQNIPDTNGHPLWVTAASAVSVGATAAIAPGQWSAAVRQAVDGAPGASAFQLIQSASNRYDLTVPGRPVKTGITTWEDMFRTPTPYAGGVRVEWIITDTNKPHMVGFDADSSLAESPSPYNRFDWALYPTNVPSPGALYRYKAGGALPLLSGGALQVGDHMALVYDGRQVTAWHNGVLLLTDAAVPQLAAMFVVGSIRDPGEALHDLAIAAGGADGVDGIDGEDGKWIEFVFRRAPTQPATPTGNGIPSGWTDDPLPGADPLWMSKAKQELDGTLVVGETWSAPVRHDGPPGADGADGVDGIDGKLIEFVWRRAVLQPATPTGNGIPSGWFDQPPGGVDALWMSMARQELDGTLVAGETWSAPIRHDGPPGINGGNAAQVLIYQRAAAAPAAPSGTATYTFATGAITGLNNGWQATPPATNGQPLWVRTATAWATGATDTIASGEWSGATKLVEDGAGGAAGLNNAPVFIYQRAATAAAAPSTNVTYTFATGGTTGLNNGWLAIIPAANGQPLWVRHASASSTAASDVIAPAEWSAAQKLAEDGADGVDGIDGDDGADGISAVQPAPFVVQCAINGTPLVGSLPQSRQLRILHGPADVTATYSWSVQGTPVDCTLTVNAAGVVTLLGISADSASGQIKAARAGFPDMLFDISATRTRAGGAGISVSASFLSPIGPTYAVRAGPTAGMPVPADRAVRATASATFFATGGAVTVDGYAQYSLDDGASWTTFGGAFTGTALPFEPGSVIFIGNIAAIASPRIMRFRLMTRVDNPANLQSWSAQPLLVEVT